MAGGLELTWGTMQRLHSELVWTTSRFFLVPSMYLEQARAKNWPATKIAFCHFEKILIFAHGVGFGFLRSFGLHYEFDSCLNIICVMFVIKGTIRNEFGDLAS